MFHLLLAHHLESYHFPLLALMFVAGMSMGWQVVSFLLARRRGVSTDQI